ncbi:aldehyde ferredoxin oxidoreductase family protein [uncultured Desulfosarcina sp.]|uniref:aldehyde ferredoxin oxidoreductase family protein n=1 Tax=uncultured Desulfosarcina sp. TaxID=218289 RepID=UPI0029C9411E|nr:aldehyde ferredoxin oxidoreductase family protein [uncultured Desulfosarcina sp.]
MDRSYMGKVLWVNLSTGVLSTERIPDKIYSRFLSGTGLASWLLYHRIPDRADPLGPDNVLGFVSGVLTGSGSLFTGRWMVVGKSPLTGTWGDANCGGNLSPGIKGCGFDGIFFTGQSERPVYFYADTRKAELRDASHLWGKDAIETERILIKAHGKKQRARVACIGMAGERRSLISGIVNHGGRLAARSGLGAVMGAKKLKAVVLCGAHRVKVYDRKQMKALSLKCNEHVAFQPPFLNGTMTAYLGTLMRLLPTQMELDGMLYKIMLKKWGTVNQNQMAIETGDAPVMNWKGSNRDFGLEQSKLIDPDEFTKPVVAKYFCYSCPLGCGGINLAPDGKTEVHRPEYESTIALGGLCLNEDADSIYYLNELLNRAGMDTISVGGTVAFAIECYETGLLTTEETDGLKLTWGNTDAIVQLVEKMVKREGIGDLLADGVKRAALQIGKGADKMAINAGGQELAMHDGRFDPGFAVHNVVEPTPGRHTIGSYMYYEMFQLWRQIPDLPDPSLLYFKGSKYRASREKAVMAAACSQYMNVINGAGCCLFGALLGAHRIPVFDWLNVATGWDADPEAYMRVGHRIQTVKQLFNIKQGVSPRDIRISRRVLGDPPQKEGANKGRTVPLEKLRRYYWQEMGYDMESGVPTAACLARLGLEDEAL